MSLTVVPVTDPVTGGRDHRISDRQYVLANITFDSSYPTGGEPVGAAELAALGFDNAIDAIIPCGVPAAGTRLISYDAANKKLKVFTALSTEAGSTSDQSAITFFCLVIGQ